MGEPEASPAQSGKEWWLWYAGDWFLVEWFLYAITSRPPRECVSECVCYVTKEYYHAPPNIHVYSYIQVSKQVERNPRTGGVKTADSVLYYGVIIRA